MVKLISKNVPEKKKKKVSMTPRRMKLISKLSENVSKQKPDSLKKVLKSAGYSDEISKQPSRVMRPLQEAGILDPLIADLDERIQWAKDSITKKKLGKQGAYQGALTLDILIKNRNLLAGKPTGRTALDVDDEQFSRILDRIGKKK